MQLRPSGASAFDAFLARLEVSQWKTWETDIRRLRTADAVRRWARRAKKWLIAGHGGFPERTALRPRLNGVIRRDGYRIEKIIFESRTNYFVPAVVHVPESRRPPSPAVVQACGHYPEGKGHPDYQRLAIELALQGVLVCTPDPLGQGERGEYADFASGENVAGDPVGAHHLACKPSLLLGRNVIHYRSWDKIRTLDYLCARPDVDAGRIGFFGHSGGGQMTYLMCGLDDRIGVAAISSGSGSCEHPQFNPRLPGAHFIGDNLDYLASFIPRPLLVMIGEEEKVYLDRWHRHEPHLRRLYHLCGLSEQIRFAVNKGAHDFDRQRREQVRDWFVRWLHPAPGAGKPAGILPEPMRKLNCTASGNTLISLKSETVVSMNTREVRRQAGARRAPRTTQELAGLQARLRARLRRLLALPADCGPLAPRVYETRLETNTKVESLIFNSERGRTVPSRLYLPTSSRPPYPAVIFLDDRGKDEASPGIHSLRARCPGVAVLTLDVAGIGDVPALSTTVVRDHPMVFSIQSALAMRALKTGRPLIGMRVNDVLRAVEYLSHRREIDVRRIALFGIGSGALWAVCTAALDKRICAVAAADLLISYATLVENRFTSGTYVADFIPGLLKHGDVADILTCVGPRPMAVIGCRNHLGVPARPGAQQRTLASTRRSYRLLGARGALKILCGVPDQRCWSVLVAAEFISRSLRVTTRKRM